MEFVHIQLLLYYKILPFSSIFLQFFCFFPQIFPFLDPDPGGKMSAYPCGSGSTALVYLSFKCLINVILYRFTRCGSCKKSCHSCRMMRIPSPRRTTWSSLVTIPAPALWPLSLASGTSSRGASSTSQVRQISNVLIYLIMVRDDNIFHRSKNKKNLILEQKELYKFSK